MSSGEPLAPLGAVSSVVIILNLLRSAVRVLKQTVAPERGYTLFMKPFKFDIIINT